MSKLFSRFPRGARLGEFGVSPGKNGKRMVMDIASLLIGAGLVMTDVYASIQRSREIAASRASIVDEANPLKWEPPRTVAPCDWDPDDAGRGLRAASGGPSILSKRGQAHSLDAALTEPPSMDGCEYVDQSRDSSLTIKAPAAPTKDTNSPHGSQSGEIIEAKS